MDVFLSILCSVSFYTTLLMEINHPAPYVYIGVWRIHECLWITMDIHAFLGLVASLKSVWKKFNKNVALL